jgi:hypothetical protein
LVANQLSWHYAMVDEIHIKVEITVRRASKKQNYSFSIHMCFATFSKPPQVQVHLQSKKVGRYCKSMKVEQRTHQLSSLLVTHEELEINQVHKGLHTVVAPAVGVAVVAFAVGAFCKSI